MLVAFSVEPPEVFGVLGVGIVRDGRQVTVEHAMPTSEEREY